MTQPLKIRPACEADIPHIHRLLEIYAAQGVVLRRSQEDIKFYLANFNVVEEDEKILGCAAVRDFGGDLLELRSLVIDPEQQGCGLGRALVEAIITKLSQTRPNCRLFTLTGQPGFFKALKFQVVNRELFPEKIWSDCSKCPKNHCCDETALLYRP